ncbi:MAG: hypothetical protein JWP76_2088 [Dactylosporangium sp.]|jgi:hypothetical protein|nr:hypothetical protein [Dactylosporangium sp.]
MQRARRLALLAVLALVGTFALTGCRSQPGAAIYLGSTTYSQKYVDGLADQLQKASNLARGDVRQSIAQWLVMRDLGKRMVADNHWPAPQVDEQSVTTQIQDGLRAGGQGDTKGTSVESFRPLIQVFAQYQAYRGVVQQHITLERASEADYADLYQRAKAAGQVPPGMDVATYAQSLGAQNEQAFQATLGLRKLYVEAIKKADLLVNPKYGLTELVLLSDQQNHPMVVAPIKAGQSAVVPAPAETTQSQSPSNG